MNIDLTKTLYLDENNNLLSFSIKDTIYYDALEINTGGLIRQNIRHKRNEYENCLLNIKNNITEINDISDEHLTIELFSAATKHNIDIFKRIINITDDILLYMVGRNGLLIQFVDIEKYNDDFAYSLYSHSLCNNGKSLKYVKNKTEVLCIIAIKNNIDAIKYVNLYTIDILLELKQKQITSKYQNNYLIDFVTHYDENDINLKYILHRLFLINWAEYITYEDIDIKQTLIWAIKFNYFDYFIKHINDIKN